MRKLLTLLVFLALATPSFAQQCPANTWSVGAWGVTLTPLTGERHYVNCQDANGQMYYNGGIFTRYNNTAVVESGVPPIYAEANLLTQGAAIAATTIWTTSVVGGGFYRISWNAKVTTVGTVSSTLGGATGFQITYTDADDSVALTPLAHPSAAGNGNTTAVQLSGVVLVNAKANSNIQYAYGYTDGGGATNMKYSLHIRVEKM